MRILFSSWPAYGHLLPMLPLARAAVRAGHDVLISSGADISGLIERRGFRAHQAGPTLQEAYAAAGAAMAELGGLIRDAGDDPYGSVDQRGQILLRRGRRDQGR